MAARDNESRGDVASRDTDSDDLERELQAQLDDADAEHRGGSRGDNEASVGTGAALAALFGAMRRDAKAFATRRRRRAARRKPRTVDPRQPSAAVASVERPARQRRNVWWRATRGLAALMFVAGLAAIAVVAWALADVPWRQIADGTLKPVIVLEDTEGEPLVTQGALQEPYAALADFPPHLVDAVIAAEDRRFHDHFGLDPSAIVRASLRNLSAGRIVQGGSTITQQLIKILYLENDRTFKRKIQEAFISVWLENKLGKDEILSRYLNNVYLGAGATGMPAAARIYFNKPLEALNVGEAAMLAGLIRAPSVLNPRENPKAARERATQVLDLMVADGRLEEHEALAAKTEFARLSPTSPTERSGSWFADWAMQSAREIAGPYRGTIRVETSLDPRMQEIAERVVDDMLEQQGEAAGVSQAALVAMRPDGAVVAMVGGRDYGKSEFNRAVTALRQPGSVFKLFTYYAALKQGYLPGDRIIDRPIEIRGWSPENFSGEYLGSVTIAEAFARSLNAATVSLAMDVGIDKVAEAARELGIDAKLNETPSLALGTSGVSLLDLTGAYASVLAGVAPVEPWGIRSFHADGQPRAFRVGAPKVPGTELGDVQPQLLQMLQLVVERGTGRAAALDSFAAGKTGTSQNYRDAWFVGFTEDLVVGVWVGNDDETPMKAVTGGKIPAQIWRAFMLEAQELAPAAPADEALPGIDPEAVSALPQVLEPPSEDTYVRRVPVSDMRQREASGQPELVPPDVAIERGIVASGRSGMARGFARGQVGDGASAMCNVHVCASYYRSFRASDCTYQPFRGPRQLCTR